MGSDRQSGSIVRSQRLVGRESLDELLVDVLALEVRLLARALPLATQDGEELGSGLEEPAALADRLIRAVELGRPDAATIAEQAWVPLRQRPDISIEGDGIRDRLDDLGGGEVLLGDHVV